MGLGGLSPPPQTKNIATPNKMKPISPFGLGLMFYARFVSKILLNVIIFDQLKEPAVGRNCYSLRKKFAQTSAEISPPNQIFFGYILLHSVWNYKDIYETFIGNEI